MGNAIPDFSSGTPMPDAISLTVFGVF